MRNSRLVKYKFDINFKKELKTLANMEANTFRTEFIDLYREQVCLWDVKSNEYVNRHKLFICMHHFSFMCKPSSTCAQ